MTYRPKSLKSWRARRDSNTRPLPSEGNAHPGGTGLNMHSITLCATVFFQARPAAPRS